MLLGLAWGREGGARVDIRDLTGGSGKLEKIFWGGGERREEGGGRKRRAIGYSRLNGEDGCLRLPSRPHPLSS
jgi:hypothetical protein